VKITDGEAAKSLGGIIMIIIVIVAICAFCCDLKKKEIIKVTRRLSSSVRSSFKR
jgi:hypothetical protein